MFVGFFWGGCIWGGGVVVLEGWLRLTLLLLLLLLADGEWYEFDDARVQRVDPKEVVTAAAYLLFFASTVPASEDDRSTMT